LRTDRLVFLGQQCVLPGAESQRTTELDLGGHERGRYRAGNPPALLIGAGIAGRAVEVREDQCVGVTATRAGRIVIVENGFDVHGEGVQ
jgi:hypothetical protein